MRGSCLFCVYVHGIVVMHVLYKYIGDGEWF